VEDKNRKELLINTDFFGGHRMISKGSVGSFPASDARTLLAFGQSGPCLCIRESSWGRPHWPRVLLIFSLSFSCLHQSVEVSRYFLSYIDKQFRTRTFPQYIALCLPVCHPAVHWPSDRPPHFHLFNTGYPFSCGQFYRVRAPGKSIFPGEHQNLRFLFIYK
jgi:hypothetical protein